jgi:hypothetical protein
MKVVRIASVLTVAGLLAGGGAAYLSRFAPTPATSRGLASTVTMAGPADAPLKPLLARVVARLEQLEQLKQLTAPGGAQFKPAKQVMQVKQVTAGGGRPAGPIAAKPAIARATATPPARFTAWANHGGRALLLSSIGILSKAKSDAAVKNIAALEADSGTLIADGHACLADPPPDYAASWNAAFTAMVLAGDDITGGNLTGARAEAHIVEAEIYAFTSQAS